MNWGKGLILAFVLFACMILYFLVRAILHGREQVPNKYYEKGNQYQKVIDASSGTAVFAPSWSYSAADKSFRLQFDSVWADSVHVQFIWKPDMSLSFLGVADTRAHTAVLFPKGNKPDGVWHIEMDLYHQGRRYLHRDKLFTP
ncbi:MAG: FixH family protein [Bacteroidetes bacterium]|nr:FixH family protein [Bacteroidota bacterium]